MWNILVRILLRYRLVIIITLGILTAGMAYFATKVQLSYELAKMLPNDDSASIEYDSFKQRFGEDGNVFAVGIKTDNFFEINQLGEWFELGNKIRKTDGIEEVVSPTRTINIFRNDSSHRFEIKPIMLRKPQSQTEVDSIKEIVYSLKFFQGLLFNRKTNTYLMAITLNKQKLNDKGRVDLIFKIKDLIESFRIKYNAEIHYSGLPYIRTIITNKLKFDFILFIILSLLIATGVLIIFFRSAKVILSSFIILTISVIWALGLTSIFNFKISILIGIIPSLIIIIAIENCIYLINKYHWEYKNHGNKVKALSRVVKRIGFATFMTNCTTAVGFGTFIFTSNQMLREFGIVSSLNVMVEWAFSLILIPIIFSYWAPPKPKDIEHLDNKNISFIIENVKGIILNHRIKVYAISIVFIVLCIYGLTLMRISGKMVDDIPPKDPLCIDLKFFEKNFGGVMPFEISIDTKQKNGLFANQAEAIYKIKKLQRSIKNDSSLSPYFSIPLSISEALSFAYQAYRGGNPKYYVLPAPTELIKLKSFLGGDTLGKKNTFRSFIDSTNQYTRISIQMADVGTKEMNRIVAKLRSQVDSIFPPKDYNVVLTGNSIVFTKGTEFLIDNLWQSIVLGIILISLLMAVIFSSFRMIVIAMVVNLIPLLITAAIMGFFNIPVKPSTIIVFSVALGISVDNAILFLSRYRHEINTLNDIKSSVLIALDEVGISMVYSAIVLVLGFGIFMLSGFGGTKALGMLISITLFVALFFNIIVLPSLLLSLNKIATTKAFKEPLLEIFDEEDDIDLEELKIKPKEINSEK